MKAEVPGLTVGELQALVCAGPGLGANTLWEGKHCETGARLRVCVKKDRGTLVAIEEAGSQVCQIPTKWVDEPKTAIEILKSIAQQFANGKLQRQELYAHRDVLLKQQGFAKTARPCQKKPAATDHDTTAATAEPEAIAAEGSNLSLIHISEPTRLALI
eukprot:6937048-Alexandrium_andersonii.AAC.1